MALVPVGRPCEHGKMFRSILGAPEGSTVYDPACTDKKGNLRPHIVKAPTTEEKK